MTCNRSTEEFDEARGAAAGVLLAEHVPGLERLPDLHLDAAMRDLAVIGEAEFALRVEPERLHGEAGAAQVFEHVEEIGPDEMLEHETVVQRRAPAHQPAALRHAPEPGDQRAQQ